MIRSLLNTVAERVDVRCIDDVAVAPLSNDCMRNVAHDAGTKKAANPLKALAAFDESSELCAAGSEITYKRTEEKHSIWSRYLESCEFCRRSNTYTFVSSRIDDGVGSRRIERPIKLQMTI